LSGRSWWRQEGGHMGGGVHSHTTPPQLTPLGFFHLCCVCLLDGGGE